MEMNDLVEMLKARQGDRSVEQYAHELGLTMSYLYLIYRGERNVNVDSIRKIAKYFRSQGDMEMIRALSEFAIGFDPAPSLR